MLEPNTDKKIEPLRKIKKDEIADVKISLLSESD